MVLRIAPGYRGEMALGNGFGTWPRPEGAAKGASAAASAAPGSGGGGGVDAKSEIVPYSEIADDQVCDVL